MNCSAARPWTVLAALVAAVVTLLVVFADDANATYRASTDGYGPVRYGMTFDEADEVLGGRLSCVLGDENGCGCAVVRGDQQPAFLFDQNFELDIVSGAKLTTRGLRVGDSTRKLKRTYSPLKRINSYGFGLGTAYVFRSGTRALLFGVNKGNVVFIAGQRRYTREFECG
ncbi:MAG: hypothetical protein ACR2QA_10155 [Solirubrobacteraceae bacterium]